MREIEGDENEFQAQRRLSRAPLCLRARLVASRVTKDENFLPLMELKLSHINRSYAMSQCQPAARSTAKH